jgi:hypothetical protein
MGTLDVATDDACTNIVPVHFTYVVATTAKGATNATFTTLMNIIDGKYGSVMANGKENAAKVRIDSALALNEFYADRNGEEELVSVKRNESGFVHIVDHLAEDETLRNTFKCDMLITGVKEVEADEERKLPAKAIVRGAIFDFRGSLMPVEFSAVNPNAINYFVIVVLLALIKLMSFFLNKYFPFRVVDRIFENLYGLILFSLLGIGKDNIHQLLCPRQQVEITRLTDDTIISID